ncbi:MAG: hypothetical protein JWN04_228, partial [Myxococcaceae bacterium]|nr:hypothetical protein [Myxococcaceae bacterium]
MPKQASVSLRCVQWRDYGSEEEDFP